jgi:hypothetical protein
MVTMLSMIAVIERYDSQSGQIIEYTSILHAAIVSLTMYYEYPAKLVGLLQHR